MDAYCDIHWGWIWKLHVSSNSPFFVWQMCHLAIPTRATLARRGIIVLDIMCPNCNTQPETIHHRLFDCPLVNQVWRKFFDDNLNLSIEVDFEPLNWIHESVKDHAWCFDCYCVVEVFVWP